MSETERANGRPALGVLYRLHPALRDADLPDPGRLPFDLATLSAALVGVRASIPRQAYTTPLLGTERVGSGIVIDTDGLVLTIGYVILEAREVSLVTHAGDTLEAEVAGYDYETGFGLVRARRPLDVRPVPLGTSRACAERAPVVVAAFGGREQTMGALVVSRREFAGYWEYMLDEALFTAPPHAAWSGAALVGVEGTLLGVGSLYVDDALPGATPLPGNMFIPIDLLPPILPSLLANRRADRPPRPWLGMFTSEVQGHLVVVAVLPHGPAARAGLRAGDVVLGVTGHPVGNLADMYRRIWGLGTAGVEVPLTVLRDENAVEVRIASADRYDFLNMPRSQ